MTDMKILRANIIMCATTLVENTKYKTRKALQLIDYSTELGENVSNSDWTKSYNDTLPCIIMRVPYQATRCEEDLVRVSKVPTYHIHASRSHVFLRTDTNTNACMLGSIMPKSSPPLITAPTFAHILLPK